MKSNALMILAASAAITVAAISVAEAAQAPAQPQGRGGRGGRGGGAPQFVSPEVSADRRVTFRVLAPQAEAVRLTASDIPGVTQAAAFTKGENGVWQLTLGPIEPGAYRYNFNVDGVAVIDPRSPFVSESNNNLWSLVYVPGADFMDTKSVPHGAVAEVTYYSTTLGTFRRMHVYTPPGYEQGNGKYPVFYLLHGAGDSDDSWTSVGRAGFIMDNLIAARKAKPMIVVMTAGHTVRGANAGGVTGQAADDFVKEFTTDVMPYVSKNYRALTDRANSAIAGLSMGGMQTLNIAIPRLDRFAYIGVYSSGLIGAFATGGRGNAPAPASAPLPNAANGAAEWERQNAAALGNTGLKKGLKLVWFSTGKDDFLIDTTNATVDLLKKHGFNVSYKVSPGGHTWINWRNYLYEFAPQLFQ
jgi:enterochelin esterase family protein